MLEALQFEFFRNALIVGLLASVVCGIMGTLVVVNRLVFLSGGIAHAAYGGIGLAFFFGWPYMVGTIGFSLAAAMVMAAVSLKAKHRADTMIGVIWAFGMALGVILLDLTPGYNVDLMSYLFGSILTVPGSDIRVMLILCALVAGLVWFFYDDLLAMSYDEEFARIRGVSVVPLYCLMIAMVAVTVVMVIRVVGLILVIALLTIPPFMVERYVRTLFQMMLGSILLGGIFTTVGLGVSYQYNLTSGASIILVAGTAFFLVCLVERRHSRKPSPASAGRQKPGQNR